MVYIIQKLCLLFQIWMFYTIVDVKCSCNISSWVIYCTFLKAWINKIYCFSLILMKFTLKKYKEKMLLVVHFYINNKDICWKNYLSNELARDYMIYWTLKEHFFDSHNNVKYCVKNKLWIKVKPLLVNNS